MVKSKEVRAAIEATLRAAPPPGADAEAALLLAFEGLARKYPMVWNGASLGTEIVAWGPELYRRNRVRFEPFVLAHLPQWGWSKDEWQRNAAALEAWMKEADEANSTQLYSRLLLWKLSSLGRKEAREKWSGELMRRASAATPAQMPGVFERFSQYYPLTEDQALVLLEKAPRLAPSYIMERLPSRLSFLSGDPAKKPWRRLMEAAERAGNRELHLRLYRAQTPGDEWKRDVLALARSIDDPAELCLALKERHTEDWNLDRGPVLLELAKMRGRDVFPYLRTKLSGTFSERVWGGRKSWYKDLLGLAEERGWWDLYGAAINRCGNNTELDRAVREVLDNPGLPEREARARLLEYAGVSREWHFPGLSLYFVKALGDETAVRLYERFPDLARGAFRPNLTPRWRTVYPKLTTKLLAAGDEEMHDHFAAALMVMEGSERQPKEVRDEIKLFETYYFALRENAELFARRASSVLGKVPAFSIWNAKKLIADNSLARVFLGVSNSRYLSSAQAVRDLLEAPQIQVQLLGFRVLSLDDERARRMAADNLDLLLPTLLRPLHRATRLAAFTALEGAMRSDAAVGARILAKAREAMDLPDKRYPKEALIGLIGRTLARWPELRSAVERPRVYGMANA